MPILWNSRETPWLVMQIGGAAGPGTVHNGGKERKPSWNRYAIETAAKRAIEHRKPAGSRLFERKFD
jgi:hypothetical protein